MVSRRQVLDTSAAVWAGALAGLVFFAVTVWVVPLVEGGSPWIMTRLFASVILGESIVAPPATFHLAALVVSLLVDLTLAVGFSLVLAAVVHRGGLLTGILGGLALGLALYLINFYTFSYFFPWFFAMRSWAMAGSHVLFGALAGGIYELLEVEEFVRVED